MTDFYTQLGQFGFPIVVAGFLLFRIENKMEKLTDAISANTLATNRLVDMVKNLKDIVRDVKKK